MMRLVCLPLMLLACWLLLPTPQACASPNTNLTQAVAIAKELRCPMATNQNLFESENAIASELKAQIYQMVEQGQTRDQILDFMTQRYGQQIRYQPQLGLSTALLWAAPLLIFLCFILLALRQSRTRQKM